MAGAAAHRLALPAPCRPPGLVTSTVQMLVLGSGIGFADRGSHTLKGVPDQWQLFAVEHA